MIFDLLLFLSGLVKGKIKVLFLVLIILFFSIVDSAYPQIFIINVLCLFLLSLINRFLGTKSRINSVFMILEYSVLVDVICFFVYPEMVFGVSIFQYVWQGIVFNYRYLMIDMAFGLCFNLCLKMAKGGTLFENKIGGRGFKNS